MVLFSLYLQNMAMQRNFRVIFDKFNVNGICLYLLILYTPLE